MKLKSFFKRLILVEEVVEKFNSSINGEILVYEDLFSRHSMKIGGVSQSGGLVVDIWRIAISQISSFKFPPARLCQAKRAGQVSNCLILGLGCGNSAKLVSEKFPQCEIVGVEIDPVVIKVGKKYFGLDKIPNLKIEVEDALEVRKWEMGSGKLDEEVRNKKWDLVLVDLYLGQRFLKKVENEDFINGLKRILNDKGIVVFNRFYWGKYRGQAEDFKEVLGKYFPKVWTKKTVSNLLIFCQVV